MKNKSRNNSEQNSNNQGSASDGSFANATPFQAQQKAGKSNMADQHISGISMTILIVFILLGTGAAIIMDSNGINDGIIFAVFAAFLLIGFYLFFAIQVARQWEKAVVLRMGKMRGLRGPGFFLDSSGCGNHYHLGGSTCDGNAVLCRENLNP